MLAVSTGCADPRADLPDAVASLEGLGVDAIALHRPPRPLEVPALRKLAKRLRVVAVFGEGGAEIGCPLLVVEGGAAGADRERSLEALCRRIHAIRGKRVALRTPPDAAHHPSPAEIAMVVGAVRHAGYWHDAGRGGADYLDAAGEALLGASFDPLLAADLVGLRQALPSGAPAVVACMPGAPRSALLDAVRLARGVFG